MNGYFLMEEDEIERKQDLLKILPCLFERDRNGPKINIAHAYSEAIFLVMCDPSMNKL
jgi:hypothetical protein